MTPKQRRKLAYQRLGKRYKPERFADPGAGLPGEAYTPEREEAAQAKLTETTGGVEAERFREALRTEQETIPVLTEADIRPKAGPGHYPPPIPQPAGIGVGLGGQTPVPQLAGAGQPQIMGGGDFNTFLRSVGPASRQQTETIDGQLAELSPEDREEAIRVLSSKPELSNWSQQSRFRNAPGSRGSNALAALTGLRPEKKLGPLELREKWEHRKREIGLAHKKGDNEAVRRGILAINIHHAKDENGEYILADMPEKIRTRIDKMQEFAELGGQLEPWEAYDKQIRSMIDRYASGEAIEESIVRQRAAKKELEKATQEDVERSLAEAKAADVAEKKEKAATQKAKVDAYAASMKDLADSFEAELTKAKATLKATGKDLTDEEKKTHKGYGAAQTSVNEFVAKQANRRKLLARLRVVAAEDDEQELAEVVNEVREMLGLKPKEQLLQSQVAAPVEGETVTPNIPERTPPAEVDSAVAAATDGAAGSAGPAAGQAAELPKPSKPGQKIPPKVAAAYLQKYKDRQAAEYQAQEDGWKL